eukprot:Blabericola_migrator_1__2052@NODE_1562_length_4269_cov_136_374108_g173_i2_p2_GENE_NODE_1562_length_4269_cov_136_374108_g173_i2NODE_1562_length_4269_cov_136_374108_g173_i2_p2_ORF_typecomplete_len464_score64_77Apyrase/PF06079_11/6_1e101_NODE_1562_length_4269_cov_136_374108_g173_i217523143
MADFLRTLAVSGSPVPISAPPNAHYTDRSVSWPEKFRRHLRSCPALIVHLWRSSTLGFKLCTVLSFFLGTCLLLTLAGTPMMQGPQLTTVPHDERSDVPSRRLAPCVAQNPCTIHIIADPDTASKIGDDKKPRFQSLMWNGRLIMGTEEKNSTIEWFRKDPIPVVGKFAEEGRGMELSELVLFNDSLLTFDDRTGIVYELVAKKGLGSLRGSAGGPPMSSPLRTIFEDLSLEAPAAAAEALSQITVDPVARVVLTEGDGILSPKGMKIEWACEKDGELYVGSFGKEYTTTDGKEITGRSNFWIVIIDNPKTGENIRRVDWTSNYEKLRVATGTQFPGYMIHEAVNWSPSRHRWVFLPRRMSTEPYEEEADESRGSNKILIADESFEEIKVIDVQYPEKFPERGFSSFKFVPGTDDEVLIALRTAENATLGTQNTYLSIINIHGNVIMPESKIADAKYEGIEIW